MKKNWLEWSVFCVSLVIVAGTLGYLVYDATTVGSEPPNLRVRLGLSERRAQHYVVPVSIVNDGDGAAEDIRVDVVLESGGEERERSELHLDLLSRGAHHEGWVAFESNPEAADEVKGRVVSYHEP